MSNCKLEAFKGGRAMTSIRIVESEQDIRSCFPVMAQLRPRLVEEHFVSRVRRQQSGGYQLVAHSRQNKICAVAGFRLLESLGHGSFLYVDDLVTDEQVRSQKCGDELFNWLLEYAKSNNCDELRLDCGVHRFDSHRFYHKQRMRISAHHFIRTLK